MIKLGHIYNEIKILKAGTPIRLGKNYINPGTSKFVSNNIKEYSWEDGKNLLSKRTLNNVDILFNKILGITPKWIKIESSHTTEDPRYNYDTHQYDTSLPNYSPRKSFYIYGEYNGEPIMIARRESPAHSAGQTKVYSKYKAVQLYKLLFNHSFVRKNNNLYNRKQNVLNDLGISNLR